ncbi:MAG: permease-like cell division protein FtsX [Spiribacter sp.]|jgi:cell division protein FtsX|nr:permease-like cell division protein FtsX [Spiribacter sp.]MDR9480119.1 permease-like cell division protein FtsX [Spiribacter sp.]
MKLPATLHAWLEQHARAAISTLGGLRLRLASSLMTTAVIGIALALPAGFLLLVDNLEAATANQNGTPQASAFLQADLGIDQQRDIANQIQALAGVTEVEHITPEVALSEFQRRSGMQETLALLEDNPLPPVVVAQLESGLSGVDADALVKALEAIAAVEEVRLDRVWLERLDALMQLANRGSGLIALLLGLTVILVVGNTIRLDIENRRAEIEITKLIGGTDAFVRRPFLYTGMWYGLIGGSLAALLLIISVFILTGPSSRLASLYESNFEPMGPGLSGTLTLLGCGVLLGLLGAALAVGRHLAAIEPR